MAKTIPPLCTYTFEPFTGILLQKVLIELAKLIKFTELVIF